MDSLKKLVEVDITNKILIYNSVSLPGVFNNIFRYVRITNMAKDPPAKARSKGKFSMSSLRLQALLHRHIIWLYRQSGMIRNELRKKLLPSRTSAREQTLDPRSCQSSGTPSSPSTQP